MSMISIIIPTYNEAAGIYRLVTYLRLHGGIELKEIIVSDFNSQDATRQLASDAGATVIVSPGKGRAAQMNYGASVATGDILYFIHADTFPPPSFSNDISKATLIGFDLGRYRTAFDSKKNMLKLNAFFTRFDLFVCYGGDQTLFITRALFQTIQGFNPKMQIMEDYDIVVRARKVGRYKIIPKNVLVSSRKYDTNGWWKVQKANYTIVQMYKKGAAQEIMADRYRVLLVTGREA